MIFVPTHSLSLLPLVSLMITPSLSANAIEGYWATTIYEGVTCGNLAKNEQYVTYQSGVHFGVCEVGYDAYGVAVSSAMYTLDCSYLDINGNYQGTYTLYADLECQSKPVTTTTWTKSGTCFTSGTQTTSYTCTYGSQRPYKTLSKGTVVGRSSTPENCKNNVPYSWTWTRDKVCDVVTSPLTTGYASSKKTCSGSTTSTTDYYYDTTCSSSYKTQTSSFDQCLQIYSPSATQSNPYLTSFQYGICQSSSGSPSTSSSSDDDEVSFSEGDYGGAVTGTLICGILIGAMITAISLVFCCGYHAPGGGKSTSETRNDSTNEAPQKSSLSQPIIEEQNEA